MISTIFFDIGGVVCEGSLHVFVNQAYKYLDIGKTSPFKEQIFFDKDMNRGTISVKEAFKRFFGQDITDAQYAHLLQMWTTNWVVRDDMLALVKELKKKYTVAVLSNSDLENTKTYTAQGWLAPFDFLINSHEVGVIKPDRSIYETALKKAEKPAEECVFIDDQQRCLDAAKVLGFNIILYKSTEQLKQDLQNLGVMTE